MYDHSMGLVWPGKAFGKGNVNQNAINLKEPIILAFGGSISEGLHARCKVERRANPMGWP